MNRVRQALALRGALSKGAASKDMVSVRTFIWFAYGVNIKVGKAKVGTERAEGALKSPPVGSRWNPSKDRTIS